MGDGDTLFNAVIGAIATAVLGGIVPFAPLLGGGIAGYLEGGDSSDGLRVGFISGLIGTVVGAVLYLIVLFALAAFLAGAPHALGAFGAFSLVFLVLSGVMGVVYILSLSTLGGWLGNYVRYETDIGG